MTEEDFDEWRDSPVTKEFFAYLKTTEEDARARWNDLLDIDTGMDLARLKVELATIVRVVRDIPTISYEDMTEDDESERSEAD